MNDLFIFLDMGFFYAVVAAIALGGVFTLDVLMQLSGIYTRASQPIIVSSVASLVAIPILLIFCDVTFPGGNVALIAFLGGVVMAIGQLLYMLVIYSEDGDAIEDTVEMSIYDNSSPVIILITLWVLSLFGFQYHDSISSIQIIGAVVVVGGVILFSVCNASGRGNLSYKYHALLIGFALCVTGYLWIEDTAIVMALSHVAITNEQSAYLSISLFFWAGFGAGILFLCDKKIRTDFRTQMSVMWQNKYLILCAEFLAILSFWATLASLGSEHVVITAAITGSYPLFVLLGGMLLRRFHPNALPPPSKKHVPAKIFLIMVIIIGASFVYDGW